NGRRALGAAADDVRDGGYRGAADEHHADRGGRARDGGRRERRDEYGALDDDEDARRPGRVRCDESEDEGAEDHGQREREALTGARPVAARTWPRGRRDGAGGRLHV